MRKIPISELQSGITFDGPLYHESGKRVLEENTPVEEVCLTALKEAGVSYVYLVRSEADRKKLLQQTRFHTLPVSEIEDGTETGQPVYSPDDVLLLQAGRTITSELKQRLFSRGIRQVKIMKSARTRREANQEFESYQEKLDEFTNEKAEGNEELDDLLSFADSLNEDGNGDARLEEKTRKKGSRWTGTTERRRHPRYPLGVSVSFYVLDGSRTNGSRTLRGTVENLSRSGICLVTSENIPPGKRIRLRLRIPGRRQIDGTLTIVRRDKRGPGLYELGAEFDQIQRISPSSS